MKLLKDAADEITGNIARGDCILIVGADLSQAAGMASLNKVLIDHVNDLERKELLDSSTRSQVLQALENGEIDLVVDETIAAGGREQVEGAVARAAKLARPTKTHYLLGALPFSGVVTTNYDKAIEVAFRSRKPAGTVVPDETDKLVRSLQQNDFFILYLHGAANRPGSLILSAKEFFDLVKNRLGLTQALETIFSRRIVLFVGFSPDALRKILEPLEKTTLTSDHQHFALMSEPSSTVSLRFLKRNYGIEAVIYQDIHELQEFLDQARADLKSLRPLKPPDESAVLRRVKLRNIGPFKAVALDFKASWNILLGDNGTGKSIVLRAIAAALSGDASSPADGIGRLLRSGAEQGSIEIDLGLNRFTLELHRDAEGQVQAKGSTLSPLTIGNLVVLGFPALRAVTWERPAGPSQSKPIGPSPSDVVPLLSGEPDYRLNSLKQWIINLHYRGSGSARDAKKSRALLDQLFRFWNLMTPELKVKFRGVDRKSYEIFVDTDAGVVPLESVSQGTIAVISWIGLVLQRLTEAYPSRKAPAEARALILIDEIDAHMHPAWQQQLIPRFRRLFPNVQVIATTHSPLVTVEVDPDAVVRLSNEKTGIVIDRPHYEVDGLRADQILTSPLFSLESTKNLKTRKTFRRYERLLDQREAGNLSDAEQQELQDLTHQLGFKMPNAAETEEEREALELVESALDTKLSKVPDEKKKKILEEAKSLVRSLVPEDEKAE